MTPLEVGVKKIIVIALAFLAGGAGFFFTMFICLVIYLFLAGSGIIPAVEDESFLVSGGLFGGLLAFAGTYRAAEKWRLRKKTTQEKEMSSARRIPADALTLNENAPEPPPPPQSSYPHPTISEAVVTEQTVENAKEAFIGAIMKRIGPHLDGESEYFRNNREVMGKYISYCCYDEHLCPSCNTKYSRDTFRCDDCEVDLLAPEVFFKSYLASEETN